MRLLIGWPPSDHLFRIAFLAILVGTTFQVLTRSYQDQLRKDRWRETLHGHTVVIGYGTMGYNAIQ